MVPFRVFDIIQAFLAFKKRGDIKEVLEKRKKDIRKKESEEQEENIPYIYKC